LNILIIDDESFVTDIYKCFLQKNHTVECFNNPLLALEYYNTCQNIDVIVVDFFMPNMRGDQFVEEIFKVNSKQKIIVVSGLLPEEFLDAFEKYDVKIPILDKPIILSELESEINSLVLS